MDIQTRKLELIQAFLKIENEEIMIQLEKILRPSYSKSATEFSSEELLARLSKSESDFAKGDFKSAKELLEKFS